MALMHLAKISSSERVDLAESLQNYFGKMIYRVISEKILEGSALH